MQSDAISTFDDDDGGDDDDGARLCRVMVSVADVASRSRISLAMLLGEQYAAKSIAIANSPSNMSKGKGDGNSFLPLLLATITECPSPLSSPSFPLRAGRPTSAREEEDNMPAAVRIRALMASRCQLSARRIAIVCLAFSILMVLITAAAPSSLLTRDSTVPG